MPLRGVFLLFAARLAFAGPQTTSTRQRTIISPLALFWVLFSTCVAYRHQLPADLELGVDESWAEVGSESSASRDDREVFVMLTLGIVTVDAVISDYGGVRDMLRKVKWAGADGFMVDVWWGVTEQQPRVYNFAPYIQLVDMAETLDLKVRLVTSFHQCGGNVGDDCSIPLPSFVTQNQGIWYKDIHGNENKEYISLFADNVRLQDGRTPLEMYSDWMLVLAETFAPKLGNTITEIQVGMGPCGELRYPSYLFANGWEYCGIGEFQAWDEHALRSLRYASATRPETENWTRPPADTGTYRSRPGDYGANFFGGTSPGYQSEYGKFVLDWYSGALKSLGAQVLQ